MISKRFLNIIIVIIIITLREVQYASQYITVTIVGPGNDHILHLMLCLELKTKKYELCV